MEPLQFKRVMRGYDPEEVDKAWAEIQSNLCEAGASNRELRLQLNSLKEQNLEWGNRLKTYEKLEKDLRDALLSAQRVANQVREEAVRDSQQLLESAKLEADVYINETKRQAEQCVAELLEQKKETEEILSGLKESVTELTLQKDDLEERMKKAIAHLEILPQILFD